MSDLQLNTETLVFIFAAAGALNQKLYQMIELQSKQIQVLKEVLGKRPRIKHADKRIIARLASQIERTILALSEHIVTIDSIRRWYRELIAATDTANKRGRPPLTQEQIKLIIRLAEENPTWGEDTIADRMRELGHDISDRTVGRLLRKLGLPPVPERSRACDWNAFIEANFGDIIAIDCATWEVPDAQSSRTIRHHASYAARLATREARLLGVTDHATGTWATQCARNLTDILDNPFMHDVTHVLMDNDPIFTQAMESCFDAIDVIVKRTTKGQPWRNGYVERFIGTTSNDLQPWCIPLSTESLRQALQEHVEYYNQDRTHQRTEGRRPPTPTHDRFSMNDGNVIRYARIGNRLNAYTREAA
ncbi:MAG: helix-turn-helix domain-containing protein [Planctomycetota bacterium]|jgi:putative transposase|nr:helix-turn-helix domain-containing protein [Planctomycetota bacterium]